MNHGELLDIPDVVGAMNPDQVELLARHISAEQRRIRANPLRYGHLPHPVQERVFGSEKNLTLLIAGNRLGKSESAMREVLWRARADHPYKAVRPVKQIWVGVPGFKFLRETTLPHFYSWCPPAWRLGDVNESDWYVKIRRADGGICTIYFKTYDQGRELWQGAGVGFIHLDEEPPEDIYKEARARLVDTRGQMLMTLTPVSGMGWIYDRLYVPGLNERRNRIEVIEGALAEYDESKPFCVGRVLVPHLSHDDVVAFAEEYPDPDELAIRVFGQFRKRAGLIYKSWDPALHLIAPFRVPDHWLVWGGLDPGYHGFAAVLCALSPSGRFYVVREYFSSAQLTADRLEALLRMYADVRNVEVKDLMEGDFSVPEAEACLFFVDTEDPQTIMELQLAASEAGMPLSFVALKQGLKAVRPGILRVQQLLAPAPNRDVPPELRPDRPRRDGGEPMLYVFDGLRSKWRVRDKLTEGCRLAWEYARYTWARPKKDGQEQLDEPDKNSAGGAHILDALRYALMARLGAPDEKKADPTAHLPQHAREVWRDVMELEAAQLAELGMDPETTDLGL
jgi:phage terminase large subunit-like protein